jgi:transposase
MRGDENQQPAMFSYVHLDRRVPADHPLRAIRDMADQALAELSSHFDALYARRGRPSIPPEQLIRALLLQVLYAIRSERQLMERIKYDLLFRWFVGLGIDEEEWDATVFTKNRDRLLDGEVSQRLLEAVLEQARSKNLLSEEHFTVDGTILEAWASRNSPGQPGTRRRWSGRERVGGSVCGTRMSPRPTRKHACIRRARREKPNPATWGM